MSSDDLIRVKVSTNDLIRLRASLLDEGHGEHENCTLCRVLSKLEHVKHESQ